MPVGDLGPPVGERSGFAHALVGPKGAGACAFRLREGHGGHSRSRTEERLEVGGVFFWH